MVMVKKRRLLYLILLCGMIYPVKMALAETDFDVVINPVLQVEVSDDEVLFEADNTLQIKHVKLNVLSNNQTGFTATMTTDNESSSLKHTIGNYEIPTLGDAATNVNFPTNHWGYSLDSTNFSAMPALGGTPVTLMTTTKADDLGEKDIYFGIKADQTMPSGTYQNTVLVTVLANSLPKAYSSYQVCYINAGNGSPIYECATVNNVEVGTIIDIEEVTNEMLVSIKGYTPLAPEEETLEIKADPSKNIIYIYYMFNSIW